jgi:hypothetical protein
VVHLFAPLDGPLAERAQAQLDSVWTALGDFGLNRPITATGLPISPLANWRSDASSRALAAREAIGADWQAILRLEHDVLNLSLVMASTHDVETRSPGPRLQTSSAATPGWAEFDRWLDSLLSGGVDALLGLAVIHQAKTDTATLAERDRVAQDVGRALSHLRQDVGWWEQGVSVTDELTLWELTARPDTRLERHFVVLAPSDRDPVLSAFTWSRGDPELPPLGRHLMHAAKARHQLRVWFDGEGEVEALRDRLDVDLTHRALAPAEDHADATRRTRNDLARAALTVTLLRDMRMTVRIIADNMGRALAENLTAQIPAGPAANDPIADDHAAARWLTEMLDDAIASLESARQALLDLAVLSPATLGPEPTDEPSRSHSPDPQVYVDPPPVAAPSGVGTSRETGSAAPAVPVRMVFTVDVSGYSTRSPSARDAAQSRVLHIIGSALHDVGFDLAALVHQDTGDGLHVFLPDVEVHRIFVLLIRAVGVWLASDNATHHDRLRLRMALGFGPVKPAALGYSDPTIIELTRLVGCAQVRSVLALYPGADLAVIVSDRLYDIVIGTGHPDLDRMTFEEVTVTVKEYRRRAWILISTD